MTLASMARVSCSVSSLTGMSEWNPGSSFADGVNITLMWHSASWQMPVSLQRATQVARWPLLNGDSVGLAQG